MGEAEGAAGGNQDEMLHNATATLGILCALLCPFSAHGVATHRVTIMSQVGNDVVMALSEGEFCHRFALMHPTREVARLVEGKLNNSESSQCAHTNTHNRSFQHSPRHSLFCSGPCQAMAFQAVIEPALVLCGAILFDSSIGLATGDKRCPLGGRKRTAASCCLFFCLLHQP